MTFKKREITGKDYWRSLDELADTPEFRQFLEQEFPQAASEASNGLSRRKFLTLMGASLAMAGLAGCRKPVEKIVPYVQQPEEVIPGNPLYYATSMPFGNDAFGIVVESNAGRPTKIEGNKLHPSTGGRSSAFMQAEILNLYDPDRSRSVKNNGEDASFDDFLAFWEENYKRLAEANGRGLAVISEPFSSPTLTRILRELKRNLPQAEFVAYQPASDENIRRGIVLADRRGRQLIPDYHFDKAEVILSLDSDFLLTESNPVVAAGRFAAGRRLTNDKKTMNRLYAVEPEMTVTGAVADHRLALPRSAMSEFINRLVIALQVKGLDLSFPGSPSKFEKSPIDSKWIEIVAEDLVDHRGESILIGGRHLSPEDHQWLAVINHALGNGGNTIGYYAAGDGAFSDRKKLASLVSDMKAGEVDTVIMLGGNPAYNLPGSLDFVSALNRVENSVHLASHVDETSQNVRWHLPRAHFLETWGDTRSREGTAGIIQPLIEPLYEGYGEADILNLIANGKYVSGYELVRATWRDIIKSDFEKTWRKTLHDGRYSGIAAEPVTIDNPRKPDSSGESDPYPHSEQTLELTFQVSPTLYDGRYANNGWMQELPHPITRITWDNTANISPATARALGVGNGDIIEVHVSGQSLTLPVWIVPGQAVYTIAIELGYGRTAAGRVGNGVGQNAFLMMPEGRGYVSSVSIAKTGRKMVMASTQDHGAMEGRPIIREADLEEYKKHPEFAREMVEHPPLKNIYPEHDYSRGYQWGMTIDLTACIGCNACTVACQSENNIPVVGKQRVREGREMHWIRVDRYFTGEVENPGVAFMPVACQHCENAPCESVCPVAATVHDSEGLNVMTYNRCIGTRYCSNNCPYKVRRFNFFNYSKDLPEIVRLAMNPDVSMRSRGVMEKCTFCTQRLTRAKIRAKQEGRKVTDDEIATACQQACPTDAIRFGNINDPGSGVSTAKKQDRGYALLAELNLRPRNTFMSRIKNPNPKLKIGKNGAHKKHTSKHG